jgi:hypothetical protein
MRRTFTLLALALLLPTSGWAADTEPELANLLKSAAAHRPGERDLAWREIPWYDEPAAAIKQAREEKRPLFVWLAGGRDRDGSPLERC